MPRTEHTNSPTEGGPPHRKRRAELKVRSTPALTLRSRSSAEADKSPPVGGPDPPDEQTQEDTRAYITGLGPPKDTWWDSPLDEKECPAERFTLLFRQPWSNAHDVCISWAMDFATSKADIKLIRIALDDHQITSRIYRYACHQMYRMGVRPAPPMPDEIRQRTDLDDFLNMDAVDAAAENDARKAVPGRLLRSVAKVRPGKKKKEATRPPEKRTEKRMLPKPKSKNPTAASSHQAPPPAAPSRPDRGPSASAAGYRGASSSRRYRRRMTEAARKPSPPPKRNRQRSRSEAAQAATHAMIGPLDKPKIRTRDRRREAPIAEDEDAEIFLTRPGLKPKRLRRFLFRRIAHDAKALQRLADNSN